ncbi:unnamed protein product [Rotaria socialis]|uniref:Uncharacterized protein n=1 Tax=Rotaria socialis TaxID=392032 RepID=A0A818R0B2_9BILA|nr:unnamed protein product [Rotaria socialis]CAF4330751.1 unnamed protein product [Rotaria socialis]
MSNAGNNEIKFLRGMVILWAGDPYDVPDEWTVCDGTQATPDLCDKVVIGSGRGAIRGSGCVGVDLYGSLLNHDDSITAQVLNNAHKDTAERRKTAYQSEYGHNVDSKDGQVRLFFTQVKSSPKKLKSCSQAKSSPSDSRVSHKSSLLSSHPIPQC